MSDQPTLPPRPEPPKNYDCCGGGCADCELRLYHKALADWLRLQSPVPAEPPSA